MNNPIVPLIPITEKDGFTAVSGRDLHRFLEVETPYAKWFPRMVDYGFTEGQDFQTILSESSGGRPSTNHAMTIDMAKEVAMIQRTDKGKQARQYFIEVEKQRNAPALTEEQIVAQALQITVAKVQALETKLELVQPKADYVDTFVADEDLITFRTLASDLEVGERNLRDVLIYCGWIYSQTKSRWSNTKEKLVPVTRYSAMADKKNYFQAVLNHDVPRFGGEVMHTLKVTAPGAGAIAKLVARLADQFGSFEESILPLETRYNEKKAS